MLGGSGIAGPANRLTGPSVPRGAPVIKAQSEVGCEVSAAPEQPAPGTVVRFVDDDAGCNGQQPCYPSIQSAADAAGSGDTLSVAPGTYNENVVVVDKALIFEGPGIGDPDTPHPDREAIWGGAPDGQPGAALTVDARTVDQAGLRVTGFRFVSAATGVRVVGRRAGDPVPLPAGLPASTGDTRLAGARIDHNVFDFGDQAGPAQAERGALVAYWSEGLVFEHNVVAGGSAGAVVIGGSGARLRDNRISRTNGPGIRLRLHGNDIEVCRNALRQPGGRGVEVRELGSNGLAGRASGLKLIDNSITGAGAEGIDIAALGGGELSRIDLKQNSVSGAGLGPAAAGAAEGAPFGAIALRGSGGLLADVHVEGGSIQGMRRPAGAALPVGAGIYAELVASDCDIENVTVVDSAGPGVQLVDLDNVWLHRATIAGNAEGVRIVESEATVPGAPGEIKLGGAPNQGNSLAGNSGAALSLVNARGGLASTREVVATFNDWGTAYAPEIEAKVRHRPDDAHLGSVSYLPALGTPRAVALVANPPRLVADGESESLLTATVRDARDWPVADGTLIRFAADNGVLARPGVLVEAEDDGGGRPVARGPGWEIADSEVFGPPSGGAYLRSSQPGATLTWTFDAPALLIRYGQTSLGAGGFGLRVDGRDLDPISTLGPFRAWVERVVARDLGPGLHTVELTVRSGEIDVDVLASGATTSKGKAEARLRSHAEIGAARVAVAAHGADGGPATGVDLPFTAGPPVSMTLSTAASSLPVGATTAVTAELRDAWGRPVPDYTEVHFTADQGALAPERALTHDGQAVAQYTSGTELGIATLRAESGSAAATQAIALVAGPPAAATLGVGQTSLAANSTSTTDIEITARDIYGHLVGDGTPVEVTTGLGTLQPGGRLVTSGGIARTRLRAGSVAGTALIKATAGTAGGTASAEASVAFTPLDLRLTKLAEPRTAVVPGERVTFTLQVDNVGSGSVYDVDISEPLPPDLIAPILLPPVFSPPGPEIETRRVGNSYAFRVDQLRPWQTGIITLSARVDTSLRWGPHNTVTNHATAGSAKAAERSPADNESQAEIVVVPSSAVTVTVRGPDRLLVGGGSGMVGARVTDRNGNPVANGTTSVFFTSDLGTTVDQPVVPTRDGWAETLLTAGEQAGVATVRAVVSTANRGGLIYVRITPEEPAELRLVGAKPSLRVHESMVISATVSDPYGNGVPDERVSFESSMGGVSPAVARTGPTGIATSTLTAGLRIGTASVRATSGSLSRLLAIPFVADKVAQIELALSPPEVVVGGQVRVDARLTDEWGNPTPGVAVEFYTDIGVLREWLVNTDAQGHAVTFIAGRRPGSGRVRASASGRAAEQPLAIKHARVCLPAVWKTVR